MYAVCVWYTELEVARREGWGDCGMRRGRRGRGRGSERDEKTEGREE